MTFELKYEIREMNHRLKICVVELDNEGLLLIEISDNDVLLLIDSIMLTGRVNSQYMYILVHINRYSFLLNRMKHQRKH